MEECICTVCGYVYDSEQGDPDSGTEPDTHLEDSGWTDRLTWIAYKLLEDV